MGTYNMYTCASVAWEESMKQRYNPVKRCMHLNKYIVKSLYYSTKNNPGHKWKSQMDTE